MAEVLVRIRLGAQQREVEEWFISPASGVGVCRFDSGLPDKCARVDSGVLTRVLQSLWRKSTW